MKLPQIKRATWEIYGHPNAKWVVVERVYNSYYPCETLWEAIREWRILLKYELQKRKEIR